MTDEEISIKNHIPIVEKKSHSNSQKKSPSRELFFT